MRRVSTYAVLLGLGSCAGPQSVLDPSGDQAGTLHGLMGVMLTVCGIAYALVMLFLAAALWRGRGRLAKARAHDDGMLRSGLVVWVGLMVIGLAVMTGASFIVDRTLAKGAVGSPDVRITGQQWWWRVEYRDPSSGQWIETANELHLPVDRATRIELVSADVIHSFWVPGLHGKLDMIPGRVNQLTLTPRRLGWLRGQCAEFCGLQHTEMALDVKVETLADFSAWRAAQASPAKPPASLLARHGREVFLASPCVTCHAIRGMTEVGRAAPNLTHVGTRRMLGAGTIPLSHAAMVSWIADPQALKPGAAMPPSGLSSGDTQAVAQYLEGLK